MGARANVGASAITLRSCSISFRGAAVRRARAVGDRQVELRLCTEVGRQRDRLLELANGRIGVVGVSAAPRLSCASA